MIGFWVINFFNKTKYWDANNSALNRHVSLVEFGPGKGTLMKDILRVLLQFKLLKRIEINFIEASPFLQKEQQENIRKLLKQHDYWYPLITKADIQRDKECSYEPRDWRC